MAGKGAIELSISFVVIVVIAVLILSLGIIWIQNIFGSITELTDQVIEKAKENLMSDITAGRREMGVTLPSLTKVTPGQGASLQMILKNTEVNQRCFYFAIKLVGVDSVVSSAYFNNPDCATPSCPDFAQIKQDVERWFLIAPNVKSVGGQALGSSEVTFDTNTDTKAGRYAFTAYAYYMNPMISPVQCEPGAVGLDQVDPNKAPKTSSFQIEVKI